MNILDYHRNLLKVRYQRVRGEYVKHDDFIELIASNGDRCCLDLVDEDLAEYNWQSTKGYFNRNTSRSHPTHPSKAIYLHCLVLERKIGRLLLAGEVCDHINWNKLDNRRSNLRIASKSQNAVNSPGHSDRVGAYKGVTRAVNTCRVQINYSVTISETGFSSEEEAARRYDELSAKYHGEYASFNFPDEWVFDVESQQYKPANNRR